MSEATASPTMSSRLKTILWIALLGGIIWGAIFAVLARTGFFEEGTPRALSVVVFYVAFPIFFAHSAAVLYCFIWLIQNLEGRRRIGWVIGWFLGGSITALVWYWKLVRPVPDPVTS